MFAMLDYVFSLLVTFAELVVICYLALDGFIKFLSVDNNDLRFMSD